MSAACAVLPLLWAVGAELPSGPATASRPVVRSMCRQPPPPHMAFYRKYTEALLRRYVRLSMEAGKVPSLLGQEMFRGKVTSYRVGNFAAATLAGMRAALVPGGELALESTPNGACGCFYEEWQQAEENGVVRHFFPWWLEPAYVANPVTDFSEEENALVAQHGLTPEQIGYRRELEASYRGMRVQEFAEDAETCFRSTGECCFDLDLLDRALRQANDPAEARNRGKLRIFLPPQAGKEYIVALDPAGGGSEGDYAAAQVIERESGMQCAELQQRLRPMELARAAAALAREYSTPGVPAMIVVERNNHGHAVIAHFAKSEPYDRLYQQNGVTGWLTTSVSKPAAIGNLDALLGEKPEIFRSKRLLEECRTFVTHANGRTGAVNGAHDDCVMAFAIAQAVRKELGGRKS